MPRATYIYKVEHIPTQQENCFTVKWEAVEFVQKSGLAASNFKCTRYRDGTRDRFDDPDVIDLFA